MRSAAMGVLAGLLCGTVCAATADMPPPSVPFYANSFAKTPTVAAMTSIGRDLFFDKSLSASGTLACASCHDPKRAMGPPNALAVQLGGRDGRQPGLRAAPSLKYAQNIPPFTEHYFENEGDESADQGPTGGRTWDGRAQSAHDQARLPLLSPFEMANTSGAALVSKVRLRHAAKIQAAFGDKVFDDPAQAFKAILMSLETFQQDPSEFYPYSSKYDAWLRRQATLSVQELRGLAAFNDANKGNCARCHPSAIKAGAFPQFTDFGYAAVGVPRNLAIAANHDAKYFDLGLCGPLRADLSGKKQFCGMFRTPSLRNVATRQAYFHNGMVHDLKDAVRFYAERDTQPEKWYPRGSDGSVLKFDDLPSAYRDNVDREAPFDRHAGDVPALSAQDIGDIVAFLTTLNDGYETAAAREQRRESHQ